MSENARKERRNIYGRGNMNMERMKERVLQKGVKLCDAIVFATV
jgi:hypothetical protein